MGLLGLYMGKVTRVRKKLVDSTVFLNLVRPLVLSDPACVDNCVDYVFNARYAYRGDGGFFLSKNWWARPPVFLFWDAHF